MPPERRKPPRSSSSLKIRRAVEKLKAMPMTDRVQLLVKANLISQEEADLAKSKMAESDAIGR